MRNMRVAELLFNRPLMITPDKMGSILHVMGPRLNLDLTGLPRQEAAVVSDQERGRAGYTLAAGGVAVVGIYGPLMHRRLASDYPSGGPTTYAEIRRAFDTAMEDDAVKTVVLDIDSAGGEVNGAFDLADHIYQMRGVKPIVAVVNEMAYSAAYLLASAAGKIVVPRTGGVGSVGVIACHADFSRAEDAAGITVTHVFAGARKADFSPHAPLSSEALTVLQESVNDTYQLFVETVARNRKMSVQAVRDTEAGFFEGKKAVKIGLTDEVAPADAAIVAAGKPGGRTMLKAAANHIDKETQKMDITQLRNDHPELVAEIESTARQGMIAQAEADATRTEAVATEQSRVCALVGAVMGEAVGTKFAAIAGKGLTATDVQELGITLAVPGESADEASRAAILQGLKAAAPEGVKGAKLVAGEAVERQAAASKIAAGGNRR